MCHVLDAGVCLVGHTHASCATTQARIPERIVEKAIVGMLPKNAHGRKLFSHLKVYKGPVRIRAMPKRHPASNAPISQPLSHHASHDPPSCGKR